MHINGFLFMKLHNLKPDMLFQEHFIFSNKVYTTGSPRRILFNVLKQKLTTFLFDVSLLVYIVINILISIVIHATYYIILLFTHS
jgi:hypothetical protein